MKRKHGKHTRTSRLEDDISVTGGGAPGQTHHTQLPGRQYLNNQERERRHGKHTRTSRQEDGISITGGGAPGPAHTTLRLEDGISITGGSALGLPNSHSAAWKAVPP